MKIIKQIILGVLLITLITSCGKDDKVMPSDVEKETAPAATGSVTGYVKLRDKNGSLLSSSTGATVSVIGTAISTVTSATTGKYSLNGIPVGTYNLKFSKLGFDYYLQQLYITGNGTVNLLPQDLYESPVQRISSMVYKGYDTLGYNFTITFVDPITVTTLVHIFVPFSTVPGVNNTDATKKIQYDDELKFGNKVLGQTTTITLPRSFFFNYPIGTVLYLRSFISNAKAPTIYDPNTGLFYYSNYSTPSDEISFKVQ